MRATFMFNLALYRLRTLSTRRSTIKCIQEFPLVQLNADPFVAKGLKLSGKKHKFEQEYPIIPNCLLSID